MKSLLSEMKIYRVRDWLHFLGLPVLGYIYAHPSLYVDLYIVIALTACMLAYAYSLNNLIDLQLSQAKRVLVIIPLIFSLLIFMYLSNTQRIIAFIFLVIVTFYSMPPLRLKSIPFICSFANAIGFSILFLLPIREISGESWVVFYILVLSMFAAQLVHELVHRKEDSTLHIRTTAVVYGEKITRIVVTASLCAVIILSQLLAIALTLVFSLSALYCIYINYHDSFSKVRFKMKIAGSITGIVLLVYALLR